MLILPKLRPGATPTAAEWNALVEAVSSMSQVTGSAFGDVGVSTTGRGVQILDGLEKPHWAKIGTKGTGAAYAHVAVAPNGDGTFTDLPQTPDYQWGSTTSAPAREVNGDESITGGTYAWLWPDTFGTSPGWIFANPKPTSYLLLVEVTAYSAGTKYHTVKRKTWSAGAVADYSPATTYSTCRASAHTIQSGTNYQIPTGTLCYLDPIPDVAGDYWIEPTGDYATSSTPGVVSSYDQVKQGNWSVTRTGSTTLGNGATLTAGTASDTYGVVQCLSTNGIIRTGVSASAVTDWVMTNGYDPVTGGLSSGPKLVTTSINGYVRVNDTKVGDNFIQFRLPGNVSSLAGNVDGTLEVGVPDTKSLLLEPSPFGGGEVVQYAIKHSSGTNRLGIWGDRYARDQFNVPQLVTISGGIITAWSTSGPTRQSSNSPLVAGDDTYADNGVSRVTLTLPATAAEGEQFKVIGTAAGGWQIGQNAGQTIYQGASATTTGVTGHLRGNQWAVVVLECVNADTDFVVVSSSGALTFT